MTQILKRQFELVALKVWLRLQRSGIVAHIELESHEGGTPRTLKEWAVTGSELGLPAELPRDWRLDKALPQDLLNGLSSEVDALHLHPQHPLWLHLVKPYGALGVIPWEDLLVPVLQRPILRLPDFLESPRENRSVLDVALCCSEPVSEQQIHPPVLLEHVAGAILNGSGRPRTSVHIFADANYHTELRERFANETRVSVHDPAGAGRYGEQERSTILLQGTRGIRSPWLLWIRDAMLGRSLDAVHFICHGYLAGDRPALALAESPLSNRDRRDARYVGVGELAAFLTQTGAWSAILTDPPENYSEAGLRMLTDTLAQTRPGPVIYHNLKSAAASTLEEAYAFLFAPEPSPPPCQTGWFTYCQPGIVDSHVPVQRSVVTSRALEMNTPLFGLQATGGEPVPDLFGPERLDEVPSWISASQRHVEEVSLDLQRQRGSSQAADAATAQRTDAAAGTLDELQEIVTNYARAMLAPKS
jgi:hypothetical protein